MFNSELPDKCYYCNCAKDGVVVFHCTSCKHWVHISCLRSGPPSSILCDNYYDFLCESCGPGRQEKFTRKKLTWLQVVKLTLYNLGQTNPGKQGYYRKEDICGFIESHWNEFYGETKKAPVLWRNTVCNLLSSGQPTKFLNGYGAFEEMGWWRLADPITPPEFNPRTENVKQSKSKRYSSSSTPKPKKICNNVQTAGSESPCSINQDCETIGELDLDSPEHHNLDNFEAISTERVSKHINFGMPVNNLRNNFMSLREQAQYLKVLADLPLSSIKSTSVRRLQRKLKLRQLKKNLGVKPFCFDELTTLYMLKERGSSSKKTVSPNIEPCDETGEESASLSSDLYHRIFDQLLNKSLKPSAVDDKQSSYQCILVQQTEESSTSAVSAYTQRILKPYIRRDFKMKPRKLQVLEDILRNISPDGATSKKCDSFPIDFSYVRPTHLPSINALCNEFFWPGIDLSESLQYPDFSIVSMYKKLVVGFGFLVPDVAFNENYISFLFVHPDWQGAGIGKFMLYHLIQTCLGKDITLHVSASNAAMLLYQKFGFKPEKFDSNFYEKYLSIDSNMSPHAFFMRLRR